MTRIYETGIRIHLKKVTKLPLYLFLIISIPYFLYRYLIEKPQVEHTVIIPYSPYIYPNSHPHSNHSQNETNHKVNNLRASEILTRKITEINVGNINLNSDNNKLNKINNSLFDQNVKDKSSGNHTLLKANMKDVRRIIEGFQNEKNMNSKYSIKEIDHSSYKNNFYNNDNNNHHSLFREMLYKGIPYQPKGEVKHPHPFKYLLNSPGLCGLNNHIYPNDTKSMINSINSDPNNENKPIQNTVNISNSLIINDTTNENRMILNINDSETSSLIKYRLSSTVHSNSNDNTKSSKVLLSTDKGFLNMNGDEVFLLIYIHTSPPNYKRRDIIRNTWGNFQQYAPEYSVRLLFLMGAPNEETLANRGKLQDAVEFEHAQYGDIVQEDFLDTYHNLTYKGIAALKWISIYCPQALFLLKTDDDIFVNMFSLLRYLSNIAERPQDREGLLMCLVWYNMKVMRTGKWKVSEDEWKSDHYPIYCSGSAFILSTDVAILLHKISYNVPFYWVDDLYITGLLPLKAGNITHRPINSAYILNGYFLEKFFTGPQWFSYIFSHIKDLNRLLFVWKKMVKLACRETFAKIEKVLPDQVT